MWARRGSRSQVAAEVLPRFRDGAWLCELAAAADDETMAQVVAAELGVSQRPGMSLEASIVDYLRPKELLFVLDNCEHLLNAVSALAEQVLRECPGVRILATSREGLAVGGEQVWPLRSLPLPDPSDALATTATNDAVVLFVERANRRPCDVQRGRDERSCGRRDLSPTRRDPVRDRARRSPGGVDVPGRDREPLDERFRLLTGGRRTRGRTSPDVPGDRRLVVLAARRAGTGRVRPSRRLRRPLRRPGRASGGDRRRRRGVGRARRAHRAGREVDGRRRRDREGTTRYPMLETLRQYARERLDEHGDTDRWRRRHAEYFAAWAEEAGPGLLGPDELAWRTRESLELDNLRAAVTWALDRDDPDDLGLALRIIGALAHETTANPTAGIGAWAERALPSVETTTPQLRYAVTAAAAQHQFNLGNYDHARELARTAIGDGVPPGAPAPADAHATLAISTLLLGEPERALAIALDAARRLDRDSPGSPAAVHAHGVATSMASSVGDPIAGPEAELALRQARETANPTLLAGALFAYGFARGIADDPVARARRARREHRARPSGREHVHCWRQPSSMRRACASAPATSPTRHVTSAKESNDPTRPAFARPSTAASGRGSRS